MHELPKATLHGLTDEPPSTTTAVRYIRQKHTRRYWTGEGWTDHTGHAQPFPNEVEATRACSIHNLHDIELVLQGPAGGPELCSDEPARQSGT